MLYENIFELELQWRQGATLFYLGYWQCSAIGWVCIILLKEDGKFSQCYSQTEYCLCSLKANVLLTDRIFVCLHLKQMCYHRQNTCIYLCS